MKYAHVSLIAFAALFALPAFADGIVDDAIKLSQGGVGEEVMVAWAERQSAGSLSAADIIHLKEGKVPDRAIATLIRGGMRMAPTPVPAAYQPRNTDVQAVAPETQDVAPSTTYVTQPSTTYVYSGGYPYYGSYGYPYYYGYPYSYGGYYGGYYPWGVGLSFGFGGRGFRGSGFRGGFGGGFRSGSGFSSGGFRSGGFVSGGFSRGGSSFTSGGHGRR